MVVVTEKFKSQYNETILSLHYFKLVQEGKENAKEQMGCLRVKANECKYGRVKEQFIIGTNNGDKMTDIIRELTLIKRTNEITSKQVLCWAKRVEAQRAPKAILLATKENKVQYDK